MKNVKSFDQFLNESTSQESSNEVLYMAPLVEAIRSLSEDDEEISERKRTLAELGLDDLSNLPSRRLAAKTGSTLSTGTKGAGKKTKTPGSFRYGKYNAAQVKTIMDAAWAACGGVTIPIITPTGRPKAGYPVTPDLGKVISEVAKTVADVKEAEGFFGTSDTRHWSKIKDEKADVTGKAVEEMIGDWGKYYSSPQYSPTNIDGPGKWLWGLADRAFSTDKKAKVIKSSKEGSYKADTYDALMRREGSGDDNDSVIIAREIISILKNNKRATYEQVKDIIEEEHRELGDLGFDLEDYINRRTFDVIKSQVVG